MPPTAVRFDISDGPDEGVVVKWHVSEGGAVSADQIIAEIETDKANIEVRAPVAGVVLKIIVPEGGRLTRGAIVAVVGEAGADHRVALTDGSGVATAVGVRCRGNCPECGARVAINGPHTSVHCAECGTTTPISDEIWTVILEDVAHGNEFSRILSNPWSLIVRIVKESPRCHNCGTELTVDTPKPAADNAVITCSRCGLGHDHTVPPAWVHTPLPWVVGLLGTLQPTLLGGQRAPVPCPRCGAQQTTPVEGSRIPRCSYCGADVWSPATASPIPRRWYFLHRR